LSLVGKYNRYLSVCMHEPIEMATLREYFDTDLRVLTAHVDWSYGSTSGQTLASVRAKIAYDFDANAKYWYFFVPEIGDLVECVSALLRTPETLECRLSPEGDGVLVEAGHSEYSERQSSATLIFTRRIHLYVDADLGAATRLELTRLGEEHGCFLVVKDREYARCRTKSERPLAFISHDSRDKDDIVRKLALELFKVMCPVWYDEFSLKVGDSLRSSIERGLTEARKCIVVLSPNFLANEGWGRAEFDSIFTREILERANVILPVWHNVSVNDVFNYSPRLADKVGLMSSIGIPELARKLASAIKSET
jgi:hypothetical protein